MASVDQIIALNRSFFPVVVLIYLVAGIGGFLLVSRERLSSFSQIGILLTIAATGVLYNFPYTNDDSFIFFRYAENAAAGLGPVFNPGQACEGFTSIAWLGVLIVGALMGKTIIFGKLVGAVLALLTVYIIYRTFRAMTSTSVTCYFALLVLCTNQLFLSWAPSGMDVALFLFWQALVAYLVISENEPHWLLWVVTATGPWIRPEAYLVLGVIWGLRLYRNHASDHGRRVLKEAVLVGVCLALPIAWRLYVYGEFLPNTFYAKSDRTLRSGLGFLFGAADSYGALIWTLGAAGLWSLRRRYRTLLIMSALYVVYFAWAGGDILLQRFTLFWIPFLWPGVAEGLRLVSARIGRSRNAVLAVALIIICSQELHRTYQITKSDNKPQGYAYVASNSIATAETDAEIGRYLAAFGKPADRVITDNIGAVGYYSGMTVIDVNGLTEKAIADLIHTGREDMIMTYVEEIQPEWLVCYPIKSGRESYYTLARVGRISPWAESEYEPVRTWQSRTGYTRMLMRRKGS